MATFLPSLMSGVVGGPAWCHPVQSIKKGGAIMAQEIASVVVEEKEGLRNSFFLHCIL